jgi:DNA-3-methyladenine glycosylase
VASAPRRWKAAEPTSDGGSGLPDCALSALDLAPRLLGCVIVRRIGGKRRAGVIVETEAYPGRDDRASHTFGGRRTARNASMWQPGGRAYVYFTYGMHYCLNVVSGEADSGEAVLIRALEPCEGVAAMAADRPHLRLRDLCRGPARLCAAMGIDRRLDGADLLASGAGDGELALEPPRRPVRGIDAGPRVGVAYAGPWAERPWRFWVRNSRFVSA